MKETDGSAGLFLQHRLEILDWGPGEHFHLGSVK